ncbi:MAG TPA: ATP-binding cassette domain-containing protein [Bacteroidales bacterium]|nr:ATP-binding cassette domain-containing protein [Bacteroidales bacterium]
MNHIALYLSNNINKNEVIEAVSENNLLREYIDLSGLHGELYSTITINKIIDEETKHDFFPITTAENASLQSMSSGQQKKALLAYLIFKKPDYIILDDIFSSVDQETQRFIIDNLNEIKDSVLFIQLFFRRQDILDSIQTVIMVNYQNEMVSKLSREQFLQSMGATTHHLPPINLPHLFGETTEAINPIISLNAVNASYGEKHVLKNISWTIEPGEFWQLVGPNGSGKSTMLSMIFGDNPRGYGEDITLFGRRKGSGETIWDIKKRIGYFTPTMTQQFRHEDSVENMIISGLVDSVGLYKKPTDLQRRVAQAWLQVLGPAFSNKSFLALSFGQQRIVLVVRAMVKHPPLLILDEPTVGLDDENTELFVNLINAIASQHKVAIIYVSHRPEPNLQPDKIFELKPTPEGSKGFISTL